MLKNRLFWLGIPVGMALMMVLYFAGTRHIMRSHAMWDGRTSPERKISEIYNILQRHSINTFDKDELLNSMYRGLLDGVGDPYTFYFDREALAAFIERTDGTYAGIGMFVAVDPEDRRIVVVEVFPGSPAEANGLLPGDKIIGVDGQSMDGKRLEEVTALVKGDPGSRVRLNIMRGRDTFEIEMTRQRVNVPTVNHRMLHDNIGFLRIAGFEGVTFQQFGEAIIDLHSQNMRGLIIDLRNNPGGRLETVADISNILLPEGVILYVNYKGGNQVIYESDNRHLGIPLVILVNEQSASASEVLTGAIRDHGVGTIVGQRTFGKGVVQSLFPVSDDSAVKITVARYYTPGGYSIHGEGITPDHIVEVDRETAMRAASLTLEEDIQLQKAIEVMMGKIG